MHFRGVIYSCFLLCLHYFPFQHLKKLPITIYLFNSTVCHGLRPADSFPFHFKWNSFVRSNTLVIGTKIRLDLLPNLLLGIKFLLRISCFKTKNNLIANNTEGRASTLCMYTSVTVHIASLHTLIREKTLPATLKTKTLIGIRDCLGNVSRATRKRLIFQGKKGCKVTDHKYCQKEEIKPLLAVGLQNLLETKRIPKN